MQLKLTPQFLEMKRYEAIGRMAKVYYGPNIPNFMIELPQSLTGAATNSDSNFNTPGSPSNKGAESLPLASDAQKT